jgi:tyrosinase
MGGVPADTLTVTLGSSNTVVVYVGGKFQPNVRHGGASEDGKDVVIEAVWSDQPASVEGSLEVMVRVRKNANLLNAKARNDFLNALAELNGIQIGSTTTPGPGKGVYVTDFVDAHVAGASSNEHGDSMFLPWHRLYLLDLERQLQRVNPAVTLPYWKFDDPAPNVFSTDFMGATATIPSSSSFTPGLAGQLASFSGTNPLSQWAIGSVNGIPREAFFQTLTAPAPGQPGLLLRNQTQTLSLGGPGAFFGMQRTWFSSMEGTPHGAAHVSFNGYINSVPVAPRDPLFFLLHCNVDRLWALWQFLNQRDDPAQTQSYPYQTSASTPQPWKVVSARQWPWDGSLSVPGMLLPPGTRSGQFTTSPTGKAITQSMPVIKDAIDAYGLRNGTDYLGFAYDDSPFDHARAQGPVPIP